MSSHDSGDGIGLDGSWNLVAAEPDIVENNRVKARIVKLDGNQKVSER